MSVNVISINVTALDISSASEIYWSAQTVADGDSLSGTASISNEALAVSSSTGDGPFNFSAVANLLEWKADVRQAMCNRALQDYTISQPQDPTVFVFYGLGFFEVFGLAPTRIDPLG